MTAKGSLSEVSSSQWPGSVAESVRVLAESWFSIWVSTLDSVALGFSSGLLYWFAHFISWLRVFSQMRP